MSLFQCPFFTLVGYNVAGSGAMLCFSRADKGYVGDTRWCRAGWSGNYVAPARSMPDCFAGTYGKWPWPAQQAPKPLGKNSGSSWSCIQLYCIIIDKRQVQCHPAISPVSTAVQDTDPICLSFYEVLTKRLQPTTSVENGHVDASKKRKQSI